MDKDKMVFVSMYCKIYNDSFNNRMENRLATGQEIYDFLIEDACHCFTEDGQIISGDHHLTDLRAFQGVRIVNPAAFLSLIEGE